MNNFNGNEISKLQDNLLVIRKVAGWTTTKLGDLIGVTKQTISNIENKKTVMTKTQYIAIRAILDYEIVKNPENVALAQVVNILLNTDDLSEDDQQKMETTMAYVSGAAAKGLSSAAIAAGMAGLITALGFAAGPMVATVIAASQVPKWLELITKAKGNK